MVSIEQVQDSSLDPQLVEDEGKAEGSKHDRFGMWTDLMGSDLQMKVLEAADDVDGSAEACDVGSVVLVDFVGHLGSDDNKDDANGPIFHDAKDWLIVVGDKDVPPALEMGVRFLKRGDRALVFSDSKYAYGLTGRKHGDYELPPKSNVVYEVHVKEIKHNATSLQIAMSRKEMGNDCYKNEWFGGHGKRKAIMLYKRAADAMTNVVDESPNDQEAQEILIDCLNNIAAVELRAKDYAKAKEAATQVLLHDPDNVKALLRAARAAMLDPSSSYEESDAAIAAAEQVVPEDAEVKKLRDELGRRKREYNRKSKAMYSKMGAGIKTEKKKSSVEDETLKSPIADDEATVEKTKPAGTLRRMIPYLIQLTMPFVTYGLYLLAVRMSPATTIDEELQVAANPRLEADEFF